MHFAEANISFSITVIARSVLLKTLNSPSLQNVTKMFGWCESAGSSASGYTVHGPWSFPLLSPTLPRRVAGWKWATLSWLSTASTFWICLTPRSSRLLKQVLVMSSNKKVNIPLLIFCPGCDELELGLARVQDLSELRSMDPMNLAYVRLDDSLRILISGYLWKLSRSMVPTTTPGCASALISKWSRRFFVLRADSCLYFFKKEQVIKKRQGHPKAGSFA